MTFEQCDYDNRKIVCATGQIADLLAYISGMLIWLKLVTTNDEGRKDGIFEKKKW